MSVLIGGTFVAGTSALPITGLGSVDSRSAYELTIHNDSGATVYIGPAAVTTSTGIPVADSSAKVLIVRGDTPVYLIAASSRTVRYLASPLVS